MIPKSVIYTPKGDDKYPNSFLWESALGTELEEIKGGMAGRRTKWEQRKRNLFMPRREEGGASGVQLGLSQGLLQ